jgi:hypothetical protein
VVRRYRSRALLALQLICAGGFALLGIAALLPAPGTDTAEHVIGGMALAFGLAVGAACVTNVVMLTPAGITYRYNFRRRTIPWNTVESFSISPMPRAPLWSTVRVELRPSGYAHTKGAYGTKRYARRLISHFEAYREQLGR